MDKNEVFEELRKKIDPFMKMKLEKHSFIALCNTVKEFNATHNTEYVVLKHLTGTKIMHIDEVVNMHKQQAMEIFKEALRNKISTEKHLNQNSHAWIYT